MGVAVTETVEADGASTVSSSRLRIVGPLKNRDFRLLWCGQTISLVGDQFHFIALAWLTLQITGSALALGGVLTAAAIPRGVLMLGGGAVSDRFSPRQLMLASDAVRAVLVSALAVLIVTGGVHLWNLYLLAIAFGAIDAIFYPSVGVIVPMLIERDGLPAANALMEVSTRGTVFVGPALAGIVIATAGPITGSAVAFFCDAATFCISGLALLFMRGGMRHSQEGGGGADQNVGIFGSVVDGLRYAWHDPILRALLVIIAGIDVTLNGAFGVGLPILARTHLGGGAATFGMLMSAFGGGAVLGIVFAGSIKRPRRRGLMVIGVTGAFGLGTLLLPFMPNVPTAVVWIALMAIGSGLINIIMTPWLQTRTDPSMLGRVTSLVMFASIGLTPLSYAAAGWLADVSVTLLFLVGGSIIIATTAFAASSRPVRTID